MGFEQYERQRQLLRERKAELSLLMQEIGAGQSQVEELAGRNVAEGMGAVGALLQEAENRLRSDTIEVGIFGLVKRGKSTLLNALVGEEVSPMRVTPETAVAVWIESGAPEVSVVLADGSVLSDLPHEQAIQMATQRHKVINPGKAPVRVRVRRRIDWLPAGVRVVDTPGLDDPSMVADYERLTLAELDRVSAAVFVVVSPPGLSTEEIRLLRSLASRGVDKLFLVCNMYPDHWSDPDTQSLMRQHIEETVLLGAGEGVQGSDVKVFLVSAKDAFKATQAGDGVAFEDSGVAELRSELSTYLSRGALQRMLEFVERRLAMAGGLMLDTITQREAIVLNPNSLEPLRTRLQGEVDSSKTLMGQFETRLRRSGLEMKRDITAILCQPLGDAIGRVGDVGSKPELERFNQQLRTRIEAAVTEAATAFERRSGLEYARLHRELFASFGTEQRLREANIKLGVAELVDNVSPALPVIERDWSSVAAAGVVAGAATGVAVGTAVGGAGLALLAAGPVGWLIGFGLGAVFGGAAGAAVTSRNLRDRLQPEHRDQIARELERSRTALAGRVDASVDHWVEEVVAGLESLRLGYYAEKHRELDHLRSVIADAQGRDRVVEKVRRQRERLEAVLKS